MNLDSIHADIVAARKTHEQICADLESSQQRALESKKELEMSLRSALAIFKTSELCNGLELRKGLTCDHCSIEFATLDGIKKHFRALHEKCRICGSSTAVLRHYSEGLLCNKCDID